MVMVTQMPPREARTWGDLRRAAGMLVLIGLSSYAMIWAVHTLHQMPAIALAMSLEYRVQCIVVKSLAASLLVIGVSA